MVITGHAAEPLTTRTDAVGKALNEWYAAGKAAGFEGIQYENRDGNHSPLPPDLFPSLQYWSATEEGKKDTADKGPAVMVRTTPTIGNSSMAAPANAAGSIPRLAAMERGGSEFLFRQYLSNNLFIYPEHQDYDAGANGVGGWGDLYAVNTPCVLISQGSSYLDMPFVKAMLSTAAALPPAVQRKLIRDRILSPTLQALFRQNSTLVKQEADYFTGTAHPPVYDASAIDELKMVTAAQLLTPLTIPPLAFVEVLSERSSKNGRDYFERADITTEAIATTPAFVGRAFRSSAETYELKLSAKRSVDTEKRPLIYRWVLLQGDPAKVQIMPAEDGKEATVQIRWHPPFQTTTGVRTHRVDIGLFVRSPLAVSAPAIISVTMLPNEMRFFNKDGRLEEICYQAGNPEVGYPTSDTDMRWLSFVQAAAGKGTAATAELLGKVLKDLQRQAFARAWNSLAEQKAALDRASADPARKVEADRQAAALGNSISEVMPPATRKSQGQGPNLRQTAMKAVEDLASSPWLFLDLQDVLFSLAGESPVTTALPDLRAELKRLTDLGVLIEDADARFRLARGKLGPSSADHYYLRQFHLTVLSQVLLPGFLQRSPAPLYVDPRLGNVKAWRDLYRYDEAGKPAGWVRHYRGRTLRYDVEGRCLDANDKPLPVAYRLESGELVFDPPSK